MLEVDVERRVSPTLTLQLQLRLGPEIGVLFGRSGAGKSTLLRLISGLARPDRGRITLDTETLFDASTRISAPLRRRRIGMIYQDDLLFPHLSARQNIAFGLAGQPRLEIAQRVHEVAALCGVEHLLDRRPATLSGGERKRVGLARAIAPRPRLLLCDEPFSALDLARRNALISRLMDIQADQQIPILHVTHSPAEAVALGGRMFLLENGRIAAEGPSIDVLANHALAAVDWEPLTNLFHATLLDQLRDDGASRVQIDGGPALIVPRLEGHAGERVHVQLRADDVLLARASVPGLSARNQLPGAVERILTHGPNVEVVVQCGEVSFLASLVPSAVRQLELAPGAQVVLIIKARSCRITSVEESAEAERRQAHTPGTGKQ